MLAFNTGIVSDLIEIIFCKSTFSFGLYIEKAENIVFENKI
ncbi:hypothetical protein RUMCAL_01500 [Ruminococcus callidus ATCC 27760]|uniref:Uncharacterized protein n=1 Tax=Ruminococcus callidus ATCC 27760 TaxID=411473 RepID=U2MA08_9FIRM|nr:hypothetical protein RUMCAL_01500 [Ruminococcus callidus ATCC 27760]